MSTATRTRKSESRYGFLGHLNFRGKNRVLAEAAIEILADENPMTLRQLFYRCVSRGLIRNSKEDYTRLGRIMGRIRESGSMTRTWLVDHTRSTIKPSSWSGLADFSDSVRRCYRKDFWESLPHYIEVFVEKDAVAGTIQPVTWECDVALRVCRGYSSIPFAGEIADLWSEIDKPIYAYYLGDFDASGFDLERDLREKLERDSGRVCCDDSRMADGDTFVWRRLGVTAVDFVDHDLVRLPVKHTPESVSFDGLFLG